MTLVGVFLTSCDSGCVGTEVIHRRALEMARRMHGIARMSSAQLSSVPQLQFTGNVTSLVPAFGSTPQNINGVGLMRQPDCSLTQYFLGNFNPAMSSFAVTGTTPGYQNTLHALAGLKTTPNEFLHGCQDSTLGITSHSMVYLGTTSGGSLIAAGIDYNSNLHAGTMNLTAGTYNQSILSVPGPAGLATADVNGDGKADLIVASAGSGVNYQGAGVYVLLGNGDGTFANPVSYAAMSLPAAVSIDDVNGDGKVDLIVGGSDITPAGTAGLEVLLGNGDGTFNAAVASGGVNNVFAVATGDFNGDGKKDLVLSAGQILLGNGDGTFAPPAFTLTLTAAAGGFPVAPVVGDFNNDGKLDIATNAGNTNLLSVFLGNGDGTFTTGPSYAGVYGTFSLAASDLDGDGNLDLIAGIANSGVYGPDLNSGGSFEVLMGNGDGTFQAAPAFLNTATTTSVGMPIFAAGDFNGDGKPDLLGVSGYPAALVFLAGDGAGHFALTKTSAETGPTLLAAADMNGDGKLDAVYADNNAASVAVALGNGDGTFAAGTDYAVPNNTTLMNIAVSDVNGDGKPDVVITAENATTNPASATGLYVYLNQGDGTLLAPAIIDIPSSPGALAIGDLNGDGKPDIVLTNSPFATGVAGNLLVYLGNGDGTFRTAVSYPAGYSSTGLAIADVNNDGKPDLVFGSEDQTSSIATLNVLPGNGDGTFGTAIASPLSSTGTTNLVVADFDGDGNPDVLVGQCCGLAFTVVAFGKGDGTFPASYSLAPGVSSAYVAAPDVNGDKHPDIVIASGSAIEVFLNLYGTGLPILTPTATTLTVAPNPAAAGQTVTFTATVAENPGITTPTGTVTFFNGTTALGTGTLDGTGTATFTSNTLAAGVYSVTAQYGGDTSNAASNSAVATLTIAALTPTTTP
jgi:Bacterial Ig-like domain (group 3)/FG-GAP-like repeat/FG-GAP repeat